jgi:hypothetical protein
MDRAINFIEDCAEKFEDLSVPKKFAVVLVAAIVLGIAGKILNVIF